MTSAMGVRDDTSAAARQLPTVTCYIVVYNGAPFLDAAIDSALAQDYPPELLDVVIVDDGSTDATPQILRAYRDRHPERITVIRQENAGITAATNTAVAAARGELLAGLDADDLWPPDKTRRQVARLLADDSLGLVYCDTQVIDRHDRVLQPSYWNWRGITPQRGPGVFAEIMGNPGNIAFNITLMFWAEKAKDFFPIPPGVPFQDWWITGHMAAIAGIDYVEDLCASYRTHGANATMGATGMHAMRETCKVAQMRRQMIIHGGGEHLTERELLVAWTAWEAVGWTAVKQAGSAYVPLLDATEQERAWAAEHTALAEKASLAGDHRRAVRERVSALVCNPFDSAARQWVIDMTWVADLDDEAPLQADPLLEARTFVTLAYADEILADPHLLAAYVSMIDDDDDVTLAVEATELGDARAVASVTEAAGRVGLTIDELPDVVLVTRGGPATRIELERRADAVLTRRAPKLCKPAFGPDRLAELRALMPV